MAKAPRFNITPKPRMLLGVQNQKWKAEGALAEIFDNSFGPGRGNASTVKITYDSGKRTVTVIDNGNGMEYLGRLFQLGNTVGYTAGDIGHYGSGGTQAIIWLPEWVQVATCRDAGGKIMHDRLVWSEVFELDSFEQVSVSNDWVKGNFAQFSEYATGTAIHMKLLAGREISPAKLKRELSRLFAPGLRNGKKIIWVQKKDGKIVDSEELSDPFRKPKASPENTVNFNIVLEYTNSKKKKIHLPVNGAVTFDDDTSHGDSVIRVGYGYREIMTTKECFKKAKKVYSGNGISGWLDLGEGWHEFLTLTKDGISNDELKTVLMAHVFDEIEELLKKSEEKAMDFELQNIALFLEVALQNAIKKTTIKVKPGDKFGGGQQGGDGRGNDGGEGDKPRHDLDPNGKEKKVPGSTHIRLVKQTDDQMKGALARSGEDPQGIFVDINKEHIFVTEALKAKPVNRAALNYMIVQELATLLIDNPGMMSKALSQSKLLQELDSADGHDKARKLVRHLIDAVKQKPEAAE